MIFQLYHQVANVLVAVIFLIIFLKKLAVKTNVKTAVTCWHMRKAAMENVSDAARKCDTTLSKASKKAPVTFTFTPRMA